MLSWKLSGETKETYEQIRISGFRGDYLTQDLPNKEQECHRRLVTHSFRSKVEDQSILNVCD
jgi:predicted RNA-binding protein YlxR (DUF448 family)